MNQAITACAFIHKNNTVFIARRAATKKFLPNKFELPGGHIEYGENIVEGLKRELREEFKIEVEVGEPFYVFTYINTNKNTHSIEVIYLCRLKDPSGSIQLNPEDHSEYRWLTEEEAKTVLDPKDEETNAVLKGFQILNK